MKRLVYMLAAYALLRGAVFSFAHARAELAKTPPPAQTQIAAKTVG